MRPVGALRRGMRVHRWDDVVAVGMVGVAVLVLVTRIDVQATDAYRFHADTWWGWAATIAACASVAGRRRWPLRTFAVGLLLTVPLELAHHRDTVVFFALVIELYSVAAVLPLRSALRALPMIAGLYAITLATGTLVVTSAPLVGPLFLATAFVVGRILRIGRERQERDIEAAAARVAALAVSADLQAADERLRMAQELHDVVAHSLSVIAVQAGIGAHLVDRQPTEAAHALAAIRATGSTATCEISRLVDVLRDGGETEPTAAPTLAGVAELVEQIRAVGVPVTLTTYGSLASVPAGVSLASYRIVQEALTNVVRHAGRAHATVTVRAGDDGVDVHVDDDGHGEPVRPDAGSGAGHGLAGMRERAEMYGGEVRTGPRPGGGFRVHAVLPYDGGPTLRERPTTAGATTNGAAVPRRSVSPAVWDGALAAAMVALAALETVAAGPTAVAYRSPDLWSWVLRLGCCTTLVARRRYPATSLAVAWALALPLAIRDYKVGVIVFVLWIGAYTMGSRTSTRMLVGTLCGNYLGLAVIAWSRPPDLTTPGAVWIAVLFTATAVAGHAVRRDRQRRTLERVEHETAADLHVRRATLLIAQERLRIADELSTIIRRSVETITQEAEAGSHLLEPDPAATRGTLERISAISREALNDLRLLLRRMRTEDEPVVYAPIAPPADPVPPTAVGAPG